MKHLCWKTKVGVQFKMVFILYCLLMSITSSVQSSDSGIVVPQDLKLKGEVKNILLDKEKKKIYFSATNKIFSLSSDLQSHQVQHWNGSGKSKIKCKERDKESASACENFITTLQFDFNGNLFACGTNVKPACVVFEKDTLKKSKQVIDGYLQHTPRTSDANVVTLFYDPYLFLAMRENQEQGKLLKLKPYDQKILATSDEMFEGYHPDFVSAYSYDNYAYFFLREYGSELQRRKVRYSRVARVCKHDSGIENYSLKKFITLLKTRLQCNQRTNDLTDLFYDELQNTFELVLKNADLSNAENTMIYGVFSLANSLEMGSAICRYRVKDIQQVFESSDLYKKDNGHMTKEVFPPFRSKITRNCHRNTSSIINSYEQLSKVAGPQLLYDDVKPDGGKAVYSVPGVSFTSIVVDEVKLNGSYDNVIFAGTTKGEVYKILIGQDDEPQILGRPFRPFKNTKAITSLKKMDNLIFVGGYGGISSFRVDRCAAYKMEGCKDCYRDPYCSWSPSDKKCEVSSATSPQRKVGEREIEENCKQISTPSVATTTNAVVTTKVTTTAGQTTVIEKTTTKGSSTETLVTMTTRPLTSTNNNGTATPSAPVKTNPASTTRKDVKKDASRGSEVRSYYTEFIIMTILFVLILILLTFLLLKVVQARYRDTIDGDGIGTKTFCPSSLSKASIIDRDHSRKKLMKQNPVYRDTTVDMNDVSSNGQVNDKVS